MIESARQAASKRAVEQPALTVVQTSAAELPAGWAALCGPGQVALQPPFLAAFAAAGETGAQATLLQLRCKEQLVAGAAVYRVTIALDQQRLPWTADLVRRAQQLGRPDLLRFRAMMCGLNISQGRDDVASGASPPSPEMVAAIADWCETRALAEDLDGVIFGHLHPERAPGFGCLGERGYLLLPSLPYASLPVRWPSFVEYLGALRAGYRRQARADLKLRQELGVSLRCGLSPAAWLEQFVPLYQQVVEHAEQKIEVLTPAYFTQLACSYSESLELVGLVREEQLLAGALLLVGRERICCLEVGLDYRQPEVAGLYATLMLGLVERACALGVERLDLGQTALAAKTRVGAEVVPTWLWVWPRSPLVRASLAVERPQLQEEPLPRRRVFCDQKTGDSGDQQNAVAQVAPTSATRDPCAIVDSEGASGVTVADQRALERAGGDYARHVNPELSVLLALFGLDRVYQRGEGARLWDSSGQEVLDLTSGFGALPFGHNPPWLWQALVELQQRRAPQMVQGALSVEAGRLARELSRLAPEGLRHVVFANSGAEAVEVAIKAARAASQRPLIVVAEGGFHGKTLGALSATSKRSLQQPFFAPAPGFTAVPYGDLAALEALLASCSGEVAAFLVEPIQGEGGVIEPPAGYLRRAAALCRRHGVLLLIDEIQTGLGRAGRLFACEEEGLRPDGLMLSKALGGGLVPVAACLLSEVAWSEELALRHSSTFAGNALAMTAGLAVLGHLQQDDQALLAAARQRGDTLRARLRRLAANCPALAEVRGRGLMFGLELGQLHDVPSPILRHLACKRQLLPLLCSYLLAQHGVRLMPPLARKTALRLIPPLDMDPADLERVASALEDCFGKLQAGDIRGLSRQLIAPTLGRQVASAETSFRAPAPRPVASSGRPVATARRAWQPAPADAPVSGRFAFLVHCLDLHNYRELEPSLTTAPAAELAAYDRLLRDLVEAVELSHIRLRAPSGACCEGWFIGLPFTTQGLLNLGPQALRWLRAGLALARQRGAQLIGLGAFTSVVSGGGLALRHEGLGLTTGNAYTVACAVDALELAAERIGRPLVGASCAVIGASGAIGRACAAILAGRVGELVLVGNPGRADAVERLERLAQELRERVSGALEVSTTVDARGALSNAQLIISASSAAGAILDPAWLQPGAVVLDAARPADVGESVSETRQDVLVIDGGLVALPEPISLGWDFGLPPGLAYACMAETMTLALDGHQGHYSLGPRIRLEQVTAIAARAAAHGFTVAGLQRAGRPVDEALVRKVRQAAVGR